MTLGGAVVWVLLVFGGLAMLVLFAYYLDRRHEKFAKEVREQHDGEDEDGLQ